MVLRHRQRGLRPAALGSLALLLAACGASSEVSEGPATPTANVAPNACDLLSDGDVLTATAAVLAAGAPSPTAGREVTHVYAVTQIVEGGTKTAGQCTWTDSDGAQVIALVLQNAQITKLADYVSGATKVGDAYIQESQGRGFVSVQKGPDVFAITLVTDVDPSVRTVRLADLARVASGAAIPAISAAPSAAASAEATASGVAGAPGEKVTGQSADAKVAQSDQLKFSPDTVTIKAGQVLEWDNTGQIAHNVTFDDYPSITSDTMSGGDTFQVKFTQPGTYMYHCTFHPGMNGQLTVQ